ncbi:hypothetical protein [Brucella anthropi]|uniref:hypothetical protein n=1 Tax=Brucella anthropi TaxID=529 RepID=UPI0039880596
MKTYPILFILGLALMNAATAYAGSTTGAERASTLPPVSPAETIIHVANSAKPETSVKSACVYRTMQECLNACKGKLCRWCPHSGKYACMKKK